MPNISEIYTSNYLKVADLQGQRVSVTIHYAQVEKVGAEKESKLVAYFRGKEKGLVLNKTNATMIASLANSENYDDWVGTRIVLKPAKVPFQGKILDAIRVDDQPPRDAQPRAAAKRPIVPVDEVDPFPGDDSAPPEFFDDARD